MKRDKIKELMQDKGYHCYIPSNASAGEWFKNEDVKINMHLIEYLMKEAQKELLEKIENIISEINLYDYIVPPTIDVKCNHNKFQQDLKNKLKEVK
jgi:hypothetical protein